jgi:hypothetical protein
MDDQYAYFSVNLLHHICTGFNVKAIHRKRDNLIEWLKSHVKKDDTQR